MHEFTVVKFLQIVSDFRVPELARDARALGLARAYSGTRMPELPEISERKITACPTEFRADSGFSEPDPKTREPENPNGQPWSQFLLLVSACLTCL